MQNPIAAAVAPQKDASVQRSVEFMAARFEKFTAALLGKNLTEVAPYPNASKMDKAAYQAAVARYNAARRLMVLDRQGNRMDSPVIAVAVNSEAIARELAQVAEMAGAQFDSYVAKLTKKVGECDDAQVKGYVWNGSVLTVTKGDRVEQWSTKQIVNTSSLGNLFNQWPTRLLK